MSINNQDGFFEVELTDGRAFRQMHSSLKMEDPGGLLAEDFARVEFDIPAQTLTMTVPTGRELVVEVFNPDDDDVARRAGRTVVYLDQNKWVALARSVHAPSRLSGPDAKAARRLMRMVDEGRVIILFSSAQMLETGRTYGRWRQQMAPLMISLSRGWLLRDPLLVRHSELVSMLARRMGGDVRRPPAVTLDPDAFYSDHLLSGRTPTSRRPRAGLAELEDLGAILSGATSIYAVLLEDEAVLSPEGDRATAGWVEWQAEAARASVGCRGDRGQLRAFTLQLFLRDMLRDIAIAATAVGANEAAVSGWLDNAEADLADAPYLGRLREVMHRRLSNPQERWEANDLVDMLYLPCATAYADVVVAEKKTSHFLREVQRHRHGGAAVYSSMSEAVADIAQDDIASL